MRSEKRRLAGWLLALALTAVPVAWGAGAVTQRRAVFDFSRFHGTHENLPVALSPIERGPLRVVLKSPEHVLTLEKTGLEISPDGEGLHDVRALAAFEGEGLLVVEIDVGGVPVSLEDRVRLPAQEQVVEGKITLEREEGGYQVIVREAPPAVTFEVESRLGGEVNAWCRRLTLFVLGGTGCDGLEELLSRPRLPLPEAGTEYHLADDELTAAERAVLDRYLEAGE